METVETQQVIPQEIIDAAIAVFNAPSDYDIYVNLKMMEGDRIRCWKPVPQLLVSDDVPRSPSFPSPEDRIYEVWLIRLQGFANRESYANAAYCKNTNTLVFGSFSLVTDD